MIEVARILRRHGAEYLAKYGNNIPANHLKAIYDMLRCRTRPNGGMTWYCQRCRNYTYSYHSCGNRNCNKCQNERISAWYEKAKETLLPVTHFLATFTLPEPLRALAMANQKLFYNLMFKAAADSIQKLANNTRYAGGALGMIAVLHTWTRTLIFHPHIHLIATGGGWFEDENIWLPSAKKFLIPVKALSNIYRAMFRDFLREQDPLLFQTINKQVWQNKWVVHCEAVGNGQGSLKYLAQYVFRPAISNKRILSLTNGVVTFKYQDSNTNEWKTMNLHVLEFIRRYLMHILPKGFVKVRYFGLYAHAAHNKLPEIRKNLPKTVIHSIPSEAKEDPTPEVPEVDQIMTCPNCHHPLLFIKREYVTSWVVYYPHAPPLKERLTRAIQFILNVA
jgi:hypothetical protein